jgi:hypothetical protein
MAHFAKISEENQVLAVLRVNDEDAPNESAGQVYLEQHNNWPAHLWIQTSYNTAENQHLKGGTQLRGNYACPGYTWDSENEIFWRPQPFPSWTKDIPNAKWLSPLGEEPALTAEQQAQNEAFTHKWSYSWNEDNQNWVLINYLP